MEKRTISSPFLSIKFLTCLTTILCGCAHAPSATATALPKLHSRQSLREGEEAQVVPIHYQNGNATWVVYDSSDLFKRAHELQQQGRCLDAGDLYDRLIVEFSASRFATSSLYNSGLCLIRRGKRDAAKQRFAEVVARVSDTPVAKQALFVLADLQMQDHEWNIAIANFGLLMHRHDLSRAERTELSLKLARALYNVGAYALSIRTLEQMRNLTQLNSEGLVLAHSLLAESYRALALRALSESGDPAMAELDSIIKVERAQRHYFVAMRRAPVTSLPHYADRLTTMMREFSFAAKSSISVERQAVVLKPLLARWNQLNNIETDRVYSLRLPKALASNRRLEIARRVDQLSR